MLNKAKAKANAAKAAALAAAAAQGYEYTGGSSADREQLAAAGGLPSVPAPAGSDEGPRFSAVKKGLARSMQQAAAAAERAADSASRLSVAPAAAAAGGGGGGEDGRSGDFVDDSAAMEEFALAMQTRSAAPPAFFASAALPTACGRHTRLRARRRGCLSCSPPRRMHEIVEAKAAVEAELAEARAEVVELKGRNVALAVAPPPAATASAAAAMPVAPAARKRPNFADTSQPQPPPTPPQQRQQWRVSLDAVGSTGRWKLSILPVAIRQGHTDGENRPWQRVCVCLRVGSGVAALTRFAVGSSGGGPQPGGARVGTRGDRTAAC